MSEQSILSDKGLDEWCENRFGKGYMFNKQLLRDFGQVLARDIFAEIEANWEIYREEHELPKFRYDYGKYQSLKDKFL